MKKLLCMSLCAVLLLSGCGNLAAADETSLETTESLKAPGWSVETVETSATLASDSTDAALGDEEGTLSDNEMDSMYEESGDDTEGGFSDSVDGSDSSASSGSSSGSSSSTSATLSARRNMVEAEMREMMSVLWTPAETFTYYIDSASPVTLYAGRIYQGIPYTHGGSSGYAFLKYATNVDSKGVYTLSDLTQEALSYQTSTARIGNDCADAVFWAWGQVANSITFTSTKYMTESYGCLKVGNYAFSAADYSGVKTAAVCEENGEQTMFDCYAQMQKGDGMVMITSSGAGHSVMTVRVNVVYDADGMIDGEKSYATILEQTSTLEREQVGVYNSQLGATVYCLEELDKQWSFNTLYEKGYLPITCKELVDSSATAKVSVSDSISSPGLSDLFSGTLTGTYKISHVTITITDATGKTVQQATCFAKQSEKYTFKLSRFGTDGGVMLGAIDVSALAAGTYKCAYTCQVSTGDVITFREFEFKSQ